MILRKRTWVVSLVDYFSKNFRMIFKMAGCEGNHGSLRFLWPRLQVAPGRRMIHPFFAVQILPTLSSFAE